MKYEFDTITERTGTNCVKYDFAAEHGKPEDVLPLWVADMDFRTAPEIVERLEKAVKHGIFGYSGVKSDYFEAVSNWYRTHFGWETKEEWLVRVPGVVFALATAVRAFTEKGEAVILQQPVYHPFSNVIVENDRILVNSPLKLVDGKYEMDFDDFEEKILANDVKLYLMCSPHNPVGRVWEEWELRRVADICRRHHVVIVSDEIHSDFTYPGHTHRMLASLEKEYEEMTVTCTAPSKTFNLAGLQASNLFIPNSELREKFQKEMNRVSYGELNSLGLVACQAAYETGAEWLKQLKEYLAGNLAFVRTFLKEKLPEVTLIEPQGTYLIWLDFRALGLSEEEREDLIVNRARLWFNSGAIFGADGEGFQRVNIACPRAILEQAMERLERAVHS